MQASDSAEYIHAGGPDTRLPVTGPRLVQSLRIRHIFAYTQAHPADPPIPPPQATRCLLGQIRELQDVTLRTRFWQKETLGVEPFRLAAAVRDYRAFRHRPRHTWN